MSAMPKPYNGCVHLSCRALLENARKRVNNTCLVACSLQYYKADDNAVVSDGIYHIDATVVAYRPNVNVPSPVLTDDDFKLMGDISEMVPFPVEMKDAISACKVPAKVFAAGTVTSVNNEQVCFAMIPSQYVACSRKVDKVETIELRAIMEKSPKWPEPELRLPFVRKWIVYTAKLSHFEEIADDNGSDMKFRMVVTLDTITYLGFDSAPSLGSSFSSAKLPTPEDDDTIALRQRFQRYAYGDGGSKDPRKRKTPSSADDGKSFRQKIEDSW